MSRNSQKKIAVINDFCGFGRCSLTVSLPIISAMEIQCCPVPTAIFSNHTGYDCFHYTEYTEHMDAYIDQWQNLELYFDGIVTGFLGSPQQIDIVKRFFKTFKKETNVTVVDPVMGDNGRLYSTYSPHLAQQMSELVSFADIITPNLTEACILTDTEYNPHITEDELLVICQKLNHMGPSKIVISGLERGEDLENFIFESGKTPHPVREHKVGPCRAGTGDVFSSIIAADAVRGIDFTESVYHASSFIAKVLRRTIEIDLPETDGLCFEEFLKEI